ncbi:MAG: glycosyltransferase family 2 protein [Planctomycetes bacterium]|nr:glycosyltransferase family 2 protein [Planctomycetota bacterium]
MPEIGVVVVSYNTRDLLLRCLRSVLEPEGGTAAPETVVVDNASRDGSADAVARDFPQARLIRNAGNLGYARAANQGWRALRTERVLFLNPDAVLRPGTLDALAGALSRDGVALAGASLVKPDGSTQHAFDQIPTLATELLGKSLLRRASPGRYPSRLQERTEVFEVDSIVGACMMVRREVLESLEGFDEGYFLFLEETDLCKRAREALWRSVVVPGAVCEHVQGASARQDHGASRIEYYRSRYRFFRKHRGDLTCAILAAGLLLRLAFNVASNSLSAPFSRRSSARFATSVRILLWHLCFCPARREAAHE